VQNGSKLIGYMSLRFTDQQRRQVHFSLFLNRSFQRQGFAREAVVALLTFCFEGLKLHRISATCDGTNTAGCHLLEKAGLRREGEFLKDTWLDGAWLNSVWYGVLREEYLQADPKAAKPS
jgi:[ribosomal protein S5]-alanine N-acetyltransferase